MAKALVAHGHSVVMVCGSYEGAETGLTEKFVRGKRRGMVEGIEIVEFEMPYSNSDSFVRRSFTFLKFSFRGVVLALREKYDLIFCTSTPLTICLPGIFARWLARKNFVFEVRDLWPKLPKAMGVIRNPLVLLALNWLEWLAYRSANSCVALAPGIALGIERRGVSADRVAMIPNGCDLDLFGTPDVKPWRPEGLAKDQLLAVFAGAHGIANGLDAVLDGAAELKKRGRNDIRLLFVGRGKLKPKLQQRARREDLDNCLFLDSMDKETLTGLLAGADLGLMILADVPAFYYGTSPNKFFDYIAAGIPVLNNYPGWLAEMIEEHDCGFSLEPGNSIAFADALERAADCKDSLRLMGERGRRLAKSEFDRKDLSKRWVDWIVGTQRPATNGQYTKTLSS